VKEKIIQWLSNPKAPFAEGVALYFANGNSLKVKHQLLQGETIANRALLVTSLKSIPGIPDVQPATDSPQLKTAILASLRQEAFTAWKELMNKRAVLLRMCRFAPGEAENNPEHVQLRGRLALEIIRYNRNEVTTAYDNLYNYERNGQLPELPTEECEPDQDEYALLPDVRVKATIDNLRKNLSKIRKREPTPERLALIARHETNLQKLLARWHSLK